MTLHTTISDFYHIFHSGYCLYCYTFPWYSLHSLVCILLPQESEMCIQYGFPSQHVQVQHHSIMYKALHNDLFIIYLDLSKDFHFTQITTKGRLTEPAGLMSMQEDLEVNVDVRAWYVRVGFSVTRSTICFWALQCYFAEFRKSTNNDICSLSHISVFAETWPEKDTHTAHKWFILQMRTCQMPGIIVSSQ